MRRGDGIASLPSLANYLHTIESVYRTNRVLGRISRNTITSIPTCTSRPCSHGEVQAEEEVAAGIGPPAEIPAPLEVLDAEKAGGVVEALTMVTFNMI